MHVGLDFDGVICDTIPAMIAFAQEKHGLVLTAFECLPPGGPARLGLAAYDRLLSDTHATPYSLSMAATDRAVTTLRMLSDSYDFTILTARAGKALENASVWLDRVGLRQSIKGIVSSAGRTKAELADELRLAALLDDVPENLNALRSTTVPILWSTDYNRDTTTDARTHRVQGWLEFDSLIRRILPVQ